MFGLDETIAGMSDGSTLLLVALVAVLLGLRHATDPDHVAAVTTLIASGKERTTRRARKLGLAWGLGHATTLFAFGLPVVLFERYLPDPVQEGAETAIGMLIVALAVWLLVRWRRGAFHVHPHDHEGIEHEHAHVHSHAASAAHAHAHARQRSPWQAYGIGLLHGVGGSAGVGILIIAAVQSKVLAVVALVILALFTAVSMMLLTTGFGLALASAPARRAWNRLAPAVGLASLAFGCSYAAGALGFIPYYL